MLTSIEQDGHVLHLRTRESFNLFDIDSVSLIIGPNGSGKSRFLQRTVEQFASRRLPDFGSDCQLVFNYVDQRKPQDWGVVYYTPVQNRIAFRAQKHFVDASQRREQDLLQLYEHREIIESFGLKINLLVKLRADEKKVGDFLALALVEDEKGRYASKRHQPQLRSIRDLKARLERFSDFNGDQRELTYLQNQYKRELSLLSGYVLDDLRTREPAASNVLTALCATFHHMQKQNYDILSYIALIDEHLPSSYFQHIDPGTLQQKKHVGSRRLFRYILERLDNFAFEKGPRGVYQYALTNEQERLHFASDREGPFEMVLPGMSSGQWAIFNQIISLYEAIKRLAAPPAGNRASPREPITKLLVLIDEGDAFLHLAWQRKYIWQMNKFLSECKHTFGLTLLQLIIASHSPLLASDVPGEFVCQLNLEDHAQNKGRAASNDDFIEPDTTSPSFAAPLHAILNRSFGAVTIGEFAVRRINAAIAALKAGTYGPQEKYLISVVDDPIIQRELQRLVPHTEHQSQ
ncbi:MULTISPECIES: AAA family ATPase [Pseudomonas]|uniref:AAA family ATPase n=1 Tax=Pseudomonas TaxID=286 RepID=UPI0006D44281|nr:MULTISPECIES: AAA family ATPase [Pseudomonas]OOV94477.1 hypothetical protein MF6396_23470 [Pseudomonas sp. MF6396]